MEYPKEVSLKLSKPALRALANADITSMEDLSKYTEREIVSLHGIGENTMITLKKALAESNLSFAK
ncbi:MAG TPA: DNA-directed RNA polymerase subunit alpha C-terminal domain-containing protein [Saprospiraceae bacterium]|nr:DNA-directed RNA polymerase subunit alpha C-terminal domain-containing protein [Saprospiraceae bacterium]